MGCTVTSTGVPFDVVFESSASPTVLYQLSLTGIMSGPYLRGKERSGQEKQADRPEVKKKQAVKTLSFNDGAQTGKEEKIIKIHLHDFYCFSKNYVT